MPHPLQTTADVARVAAALRLLLDALESHPILSTQLSRAWDGFRAAFSDGPAMDGVSVDSKGYPDIDGLPALIRMSRGVSQDARDVLMDVVDALSNGTVGGSAWVYRDSPTGPEPTLSQLRDHLRQASEADDSGIRAAKKTIRVALSLLPAPPAGPNAALVDGSAPPTVTQQGEGGKPPAADPFAALRQFARDNLKGQERAVIEALCNANGELPIVDLAAKDGVGWDNELEGFKNAQKRLAPKMKRIGWTLARQNNTAKLNRNRG